MVKLSVYGLETIISIQHKKQIVLCDTAFFISAMGSV